MSPKATLYSILGLLALMLVVSSLFIVKEWEVAIRLQLGRIVDSSHEPGLHWKLPFVNNIEKFDSRIQTLDTRPQRYITIEKKDVIVDSFVKWRIADVAQFYRSTGGSSERAGRLLEERVSTSLRDEFGKRTIQEVVSGERAEIMELLTRGADEKASDMGVEVLDVRVKQIDLPEEVSGSVYERMRAERERVARDLRAKGREAAERIQADADRQRTVILAEAFRTAEELRGEGDAQATEIYAGAFNKNAEFYSFYRSLAAYRKVFQAGGDTMVLEPDSEFFRYFSGKGVQSR